MRIVIRDSRPLGVVICRPAAARYYNPATQGWETPFDPAKHLVSLVAMEASGLFTSVQHGDLGTVLSVHLDAAAAIVTLDEAGLPVAVIDAWTIGLPDTYPPMGGFLRG